MATRRMFSKEITTSDVFVDMPLSSQLLYFQLGMEADDEGFLGNAKMLSRAYGTNNDDLRLLEAKGFVIVFPNGVTVIKDWEVNNKIRRDRMKPTIYTEEKKLLTLDAKGSYQLQKVVSTNCQPNDNQMSAQVRLGKDRLGKDIYNTSNRFDEVWQEYPKGRKQGKDKAEKVYLKAIKEGTLHEDILQGLINYKKHIEVNKIETKYIKQGITWFNNKCWLDEYEVEVIESNNSYKPPKAVIPKEYRE